MQVKVKQAVTPYQIAKMLSNLLEYEVKPQQIYNDRNKGRLESYRDEVSGKWYVSPEEATRYVNAFIAKPKRVKLDITTLFEINE